MDGVLNLRQVSFAIIGLRTTSVQAVARLEHTLARQDGIVSAHINLATERAMIVYAPELISLAEIVRTIQQAGFEVPQYRHVLTIDGLVYASSAQTIARVLERMDGVVHTTIDFQAQQIVLEVLAEKANALDCERALASLGLRVVPPPLPSASCGFAIRLLFISGLTLLGIVSAGAHAGWFEAGFLHAPLIVMASAAMSVYGVAWQFYRIAFETALTNGIWDLNVMVALIASAGLFLGLPFALITPKSILTSSGFIVAMVLTTGWFFVRGLEMWLAPWIKLTMNEHSLASQASVGILSRGIRH